MPKKEIKNKDNKENSRKNIVKEKAEELLRWKKDNLTQKWFFSLEPKEQTLLEETYLIFVQKCPDLTWEEFINHLRKTDNRAVRTKTVTKSIIKKFI